MFVSGLVRHLLAATGLAFAATASAEIHRWVDEQGQVHFGDCPPTECQTEDFTAPVAPSEQRVQEALQRTERLQDFLSDIHARRARESSEKAAARKGSSQSSFPDDIDCFSPLRGAWQNRIDDTREEIIRRPLSVRDRSRLVRLFNAVKRRRRGEVEETTCINPGASPSMERDGYQLSLDADWESDRVFRLTGYLTGTTGRGKKREFLWFLLDPDGLRFRHQRTPASLELNQPRNDVETLSVANQELVFFRRTGGRLRKVVIWVLKQSRYQVRLSTYAYVQGGLAQKTHWQIDG